ncbi:MAG: glycosyltransferase, partial [Chlorobiaceae bacterium]|nr:glycosyltransferase [Chlorobiaceae bacterium]
MHNPEPALYPQVDVIIPHFRDIGRLQRCLQSLSATRYPSMAIIVIDNGSGDPALEPLTAGYGGTLVSLS